DAAFDDLINDSVSVETGEPYLDFNYQIVSGDSTPGATLNFQVIVTNTGNRPAYEVSLDDAATTYLENITGLTVSSTSGGASGPGSFTNNGNNWSSADFDLPAAASVTIDFSADISASAPYGASIQNTLSGTYAGQPSSASVRRTGAGGSDQDDNGTLNNYNLSQDPTGGITVVPIELLTFEAVWTEQQQINAEVSWQTASELNNAYFEIYRSVDGNVWDFVTEVGGAGTTSEPQSYQILDQGIGLRMPTSRVLYQLKQVDFDGASSFSNIIELSRSDDAAQVFVWPNPFNESLNIRSTNGDLIEELSLLDAAGRVVKEFRPLVPQTSLQWSGLSNLSEGYYHLKVSTQNSGVFIQPLRRQ
ncbi:MAG: T9SS type A sorting domain-containing protein, partial [Bacteroidota bacterium]